MLADIKFATRTLRKTPGLTAVAFLSLAVSLGFATAAFTVIHGAFLSPLPLPQADRLVIVQDYDRIGRFNLPMTAAGFTERRDRTTSFDGVAAWFSRNVTLAAAADGSPGQPIVVRAAFVSSDALDLAGIQPALGRLPTATDVAPGAPPVVLLGHDVWSRQFGGDASLMERTIAVAGQPHRVIGVLPAGVRFPIREDIWIPVQMDARATNATTEALTLFGRLKAGVVSSQAAAELSAIGASREPQDRARATVPIVMPFTRGFMSPEQEWAIYAFLAGLVVFLIVIASNLANLFLARNSARMREIAVRSALGASRAQLVRQLLFESAMIGLAGALGGLAIARAGLAWFASEVPDLPWWADFSLNPRVLAFTLIAALMASAVAGVGPAVRLTGASTAPALESTAPGTGSLRFSRAGAALLVVQLAVSVGGLGVVGVLAQGLFGFSYERYGIQAGDVLVAQVYLGPPEDAELAAAGANRRQVWARHFASSLEQLERIRLGLLEQPGVQHVTFATVLPGNDVERAVIEFDRARAGESVVTTRIAEVGPEFFEVLGTSAPVNGRGFERNDFRGPARVAIVNTPFAAKYFPGGSPIGRTIRVRGEVDAEPGTWLEIVGVVPDLGLNPGDAGRADGIYVPFAPSNFARLAVRTAAEPRTLIPALHQIVSRENRRAEIQSAEPLSAQMRTAESVFRGLGVGLLAIGGTALVLSAVSFYSLVSFGVTRRTREIGIRLALGATRGRIVRGVLARELRVVVAGAVAGILVGVGLYQLVTMIPFDLSPAAPSLLVAAVGIIVLVGVGACVLPVRRALGIGAAAALRHE